MKKIAVMLLFLISGYGCDEAWREHLGDERKMIARVEAEKDEIKIRLKDEGWIKKESSDYGIQILDLDTLEAVGHAKIKGEFVKKPDGGFMLIMGRKILDVSRSGEIRYYVVQQ